MNEVIKNSILGFVIGDCFGVPYEFRSAGSFKFEPRHGHGTYDQPPMTWSDDTALMLALIDSYKEDSGFEYLEFNIEKHKANLKELLKGKYYVNNILFDIGNGTRRAISSDFTLDTSDSLGNGGLLRCWLVGLLCGWSDMKVFISLTHSDNELYIQCCKMYVSLLDYVIKFGRSKAIEIWGVCYKDEFDNMLKSNASLLRFSGCIFQTVNIVISSYLEDKEIGDVIELGGDTDSNAALFGALKGAEGCNSILKYKSYIRDYSYLEELIDKFSNYN